jgi:hypothetical protein
MKKKGAMEISFGMIFSIILIIVFLAFAFWGIKKLIGVQETALVAKFKNDLQNDVDKIWNGPQGQQLMKYNLPKKIEGVCFDESATRNLYFLPERIFLGADIEHIDWTKTLGEKNFVCFENKEGSVEITLSKDFGDNLVAIK